MTEMGAGHAGSTGGGGEEAVGSPVRRAREVSWRRRREVHLFRGTHKA